MSPLPAISHHTPSPHHAISPRPTSPKGLRQRNGAAPPGGRGRGLMGGGLGRRALIASHRHPSPGLGRLRAGGGGAASGGEEAGEVPHAAKAAAPRPPCCWPRPRPRHRCRRGRGQQQGGGTVRAHPVLPPALQVLRLRHRSRRDRRRRGGGKEWGGLRPDGRGLQGRRPGRGGPHRQGEEGGGGGAGGVGGREAAAPVGVLRGRDSKPGSRRDAYRHPGLSPGTARGGRAVLRPTRRK